MSSKAEPASSLSSVANASLTTSVRRVAARTASEDSPDVLAVEEPLEIRIGFPDGTHRAISITMRTPGHDAELAAGFLFTEGIITSAEEIKQIRHCGLKIGKQNGALDRVSALNSNTIRVDLRDGDIDLKRLERHFYTTSSCGVCGKSSIDALRADAAKIEDVDHPTIQSEVLYQLPERLRASQDIFDQTGGLHASALFTLDGEIEIVREDVGRHNALDKVIGAKFLEAELPLSKSVLLVSGRVSFELVQKALMAGVPILVAVGAPSSLAVELAEEFGMTVVGFVRNDGFNVYTHGRRVV